MHRRKSDIHHNRRAYMIVASFIVIVVGACLAVIFTAGGSKGDNVASTRIEKVIQPPSAAQVASDLNCGKFKDLGGGMPSGLGVRLYVVDAGTCYIGKDKYAIDTFANKTVRDEWLQAATPFGVVPKWETDTSVTYPSVG